MVGSMIVNEKLERMWMAWLILTNYPSICLEGPRKTT